MIVGGDYLAHLEAAARATVIHSPVTYSWFGEPSPRLAPQVRRALTPDNARDYLLYNLRSRLYSDFYCMGSATPSHERSPAPPTPGMETPFIQALSASNTGRGHWQGGWEIRAIEGSTVSAHKDGLTLTLKPGSYELPASSLPSPGAKVRLRLPKEFHALSPGFYMAVGEYDPAEGKTLNLVRLYWNIAVEGAAGLVGMITGALNKAGVPLRLKVLNDPGSFARCDAAVLYINKSDYDTVRPIIEAIYPILAPHLKPGTPVFTKSLAPGLGLAEDPGMEESFGQHRCRLLAEGLVRAYEQGQSSHEAQMKAVLSRFIEDEVDLSRPYLNPGSPDGYGFESRMHARSPRPLARREAVRAETIGFMDAALQIGEQITREATWHADRCNWIGATIREARHNSARTDLVYRALGPDLYDGTAGIALFLAELYAAAGGPYIRRSALGAIRQALSTASELPSRLGLYTGQLGIAYAAIRTGILLDEDELVKRGLHIFESHAQDSSQPSAYDLLSGSAGAIVGLLAVDRMLERESFTESALWLADELLSMADKSRAGYSWVDPTLNMPHNLTGLSHGASGIGYALLELYAATGKQEYWEAAERAFDYERHWFDAKEGNWPDLRKLRGRGKDRRSWQFVSYWCHGAPGIALARLRAYELLGDETRKAEARLALKTTAKSIEAALWSEASNFSLCHGLAGNAEVLMHGAEILGPGEGIDSNLAEEVARLGVERYVGKNAAWPCGVAGGDTPGLLLGRAGIGLFYLRLHNPLISSILLPGRIRK